MSAAKQPQGEAASESRLKVVPGTLEHKAYVQQLCADLVDDGEYKLVAQLLHDNFSNQEDESEFLGLARRVLGEKICVFPEIDSGAICGPSPHFNRTLVQLPESYSPIQRVMTVAWAIGHYATRIDQFAPDDEAYAVAVELVAIIYGREQATEWIRTLNAEREGRYPELMPESEAAQ